MNIQKVKGPEKKNITNDGNIKAGFYSTYA
jgi:hypothetical protein